MARLQARFHPAPLPALADWIAGGAEAVLATWRGAGAGRATGRGPRRPAALRERLAALVKTGQLTPILALLDDPAVRSADAAAAQLAEAASGGLNAALAAIEAGAPARAELATRLGQEIAAALGLGALVTMLVLAVMG
jgi:hypothetical protein